VVVFEFLDNWIGLHIDIDTGMPLAFSIREGGADQCIFREKDYNSLEHQHPCRTRLFDDEGKPSAWFGKDCRLWNILYSIFQSQAASEYMNPFTIEREILSYLNIPTSLFLGKELTVHCHRNR
jgi:hypothetical protein